MDTCVDTVSTRVEIEPLMLNADTPDPRSRHILAATPQHPNINHVELSIRAPKRQTITCVGEQTTAL